jgi:ATP-binding protein involved in chromosome partitioning
VGSGAAVEGGLLQLLNAMIDHDSVLKALSHVRYPGYSRDIVSFGLVKKASVDDGSIHVEVELTSANPDTAHRIKEDAEIALRALPDVRQVNVEVKMPGAHAPGGQSQNPWASQARVPGIKRIVAVASGKGGVGKSTCSTNLACALHQLGARVGLLDCDIYGPSIPLMMGVQERPGVSADEKLIPPSNYGVKLMSIGFLLDSDQPVIWRGPMIVKAIQQFLHAVEWGELDFLLVDLPPGTGDAQLTLCQTAPLDGGVIVTTPQEASLGVVRKGIKMFEKVNVPILGLIENMSCFVTPAGERFHIFGDGGGRLEAERQKIPFLGEIPICTAIREGGDKGQPVVCTGPDTPEGQAFVRIAAQLRDALK